MIFSSKRKKAPLSDTYELDNGVDALSYRYFIVAMVGVLLLTTFAGIRGLTFDSIWYDEWRSLVYIGKTTVNDSAQISGTLQRVIEESDALNPPAYYFLLSIWGTFTGAETTALRYFSVMLGVLNVAMLYRVGTDVHSRQVGLAAAMILGTSSMFGVFMHEMRTYALAMLLVTLHLWTYWRCIQPTAKRWHYVAFVLVIGVAMHTHYTAVLMLGGTFVYHIAFVRRQWWLLGLYVAGALLILPWASVVVASGALDNVQDRANTAMPLTEILRTLNRMVANEFFWLAIPTMLLALGRGRIVWVHVLIGIAAYLTLNALVPFACCRRYMMVMLPGFALLIALGITRNRWLAAAFIALFIGTGFYTGSNLYFAHSVTNTPRWHYPWEDVYAAVPANLQPGDTVLALLPGGINEWTHVGLAAHFFPQGNAEVVQTFRSIPREDTLNEVIDKTFGSERVWIAYKKSWDAYHREDIQQLMALSYTNCGTVLETEDAVITLYVRGSQDCG